ncbi:phenazine biosynthesis protein phzE [Streptosporangium becharense]|uniref:anthranilate synthase n=1 Tax=Streptosporangium becharense TaxID=1816182 RepID=A0A7W9IKS9_9ACTN|nr:anthranilate synthase family protein [Streptosporangium becharense]MBB2911038.1 phenazine biosynthesis protein phzE [Streptosporangium becharense]MBB5821904.1 phenazine biosynthesis protein phzE [Streptosporangium becharense]
MSAPAVETGRDLLGRVLALETPAFALLHRPQSGSPDAVDVLAGEVTSPASLAGIPLPAAPPGPGAAHEVLVVVPYRQIAERGFTTHDDGTPLVAMTVAEQASTSLPELASRVPDVPARLSDGHFDVADDRYAETVRRVVTDEIGTGTGSNFVIKRSFVADVGDYSPRTAVSLFRRLLEHEQGAYWTFVIHTGRRTLVGATPERHISLSGATAVMNPISGTYRYPATGPTLRGITEFLADRKETDELYMVLDEELKMMARICDTGGRVVGPYLKEMARLAHTEYLIEGRTGRDVREILRETMFAPTVTGSPLESAARVVRRYEPQGRGYYGGVAALIGRDADGQRTLDSAILIRTADIDPGGRLRLGVGATLVRHSDPASEVAETHAKASGVLSALEAGTAPFGVHPEVRAALARRNTGIADFWLRDGTARRAEVAELAGLRALVVDAEDTFTAMIGQQLRALGLSVTTRRFDELYDFDGHDLVVLGPGPGDPRATGDPRIAHLRSAVDTLLAEDRPFVAVCLSHQVLSLRLGLDLVRRRVPNQGVQREIGLFDGRERVGFYNTYAARSDEDELDVGGIGVVDVSRDPETCEVHALRGPFFASMQFHAESVLTVDGPRITAEAIRGVLGR